MLLGILSDTHNQVLRTRAAVALLRDRGAEALVHCGDLTSAPMVAELSILPSWFVLGNNDADAVPELKEAAAESGVKCLEWGGVVDLGGKRIGVVHGHMTVDLRRVLADHPDYLLSGHSHIPDNSMSGNVQCINPGALHRASRFTVAMLDLQSGEVRFLEVPR